MIIIKNVPFKILIKHINIITNNKRTFENQQIDQSEVLVTSMLYKRMYNLFMKNYLKCSKKRKCSKCTKALVKPLGEFIKYMQELLILG